MNQETMPKDEKGAFPDCYDRRTWFDSWFSPVKRGQQQQLQHQQEDMKGERSSFRHVGEFLARLKGEVSTRLLWRDREDGCEDDRCCDDSCDGGLDSNLSEEELREYWFGKRVPGVVGLRNHGNTCFMNAVLQCLSHTDTLAEYFATDKYKADLMQRNKLKSKKYGTQGEVTEKLAGVIKSLWSCQYTPAVTTEFKSVIDKYGSQYRGSTQHDAQEFLLWLLDKVHEDLNVAKKKKYKRLKSSSDRPDEVLAAESMANFLRCNESFVHGLFQAQFRSSLTCPHCQRQSNTFDPFLCLSLPIPQSSRRPIFVAVVYYSQQPRQVKLGFSMDCLATVGDLREVIANDAGIAANRLVLAEIDGEGFHRTFFDDQSLNVIDSKDHIHSLYAIEMPELPATSEDEGEFVSIIFVNVLSIPSEASPRIPSQADGKAEAESAGEENGDKGGGEKNEKKAEAKKVTLTHTRFGAPYVTQMRRETSYADFQKLLLKEMQMMVQPSVLVTEQEIPVFTVELYMGEKDCQVLGAEMDMPLYAESVDQALSLSDPDSDGQAGPRHIKLLLKWNQGPKDKIIFDDVEHEDEHESVKELLENPNFQPPVTLEQCFSEYTSEEILGQDNAWLCPSCNRKEKGVKKLALWSLPDILIVHLKRFKQTSANGVITAKLTTLVEFPKVDFNISDHLVKQRCSNGADSPAGSSSDSGSSSSPTSGVGTPAGADSSSASGSGPPNGTTLDLVRRVKAAGKISAVSEVLKAGRARKTGGRTLRTSHPSSLKPEECAYSLYAVCNHHGSDDQGGHYTAFCRNSSNGLWYCFDDQQVTKIEEAELVTKDAYILFYQRKAGATSSKYGAPSISVGGSSTLPHSFPLAPQVALGKHAGKGKDCERGKPGGANRLSGTLPASWQFRQHHWVYRIPGLKPAGGSVSGSVAAAAPAPPPTSAPTSAPDLPPNGRILASSESMTSLDSIEQLPTDSASEGRKSEETQTKTTNGELSPSEDNKT